MQTVLVVGATGPGYCAKSLGEHIGSSDGITFVEANVLSDTGIRDVVDKVRAGQLPSFQHVWASVGGEYVTVSLKDITTERLRYNMTASLEANFFAYRETINYLLEQNHPESTWTICTGSQGDLAIFPLPAMGQGALFSLCTAASRENMDTNVRFNEIYLAFRVEVDEDAAQHGVTSASEFGSMYEQLLVRPDIRSSRIWVETLEDLRNLKHKRKF